MSSLALMENCKLSPYWWEKTPRPASQEKALPSAVDVLVIGAGYTGLHAALQTARGGRSTWVIDAEDAGWGCSSRNGGQISTSIKPTYDSLAKQHGSQKAFDILREGQNSLEWIEHFVRSEKIDCDFGKVGRFHAAHNAEQYELLANKLTNQPKGLEVKAHVVPRSEQRQELGSNVYWGGVVYEQHCSVDPAAYHQGLLERAVSAGVEIISRCPAMNIQKIGNEFHIQTPRGVIKAKNVVIATNGYTGKLTPWLQRRVIPIGSYMIATDALPPGMMDRLIPKDRIVSDTRRVVYYYRSSPDRTRILFGGRVSHQETDPRVSGPKLHHDLAEIFPELKNVGISHSWCGFVAYTFDELMHTGVHDGMHYAMGYCGAGVGTSSYFGMRIGQQILGLKEGTTALDGLPFQTRPFYTGNPWFLAPSIRYYRWLDSF